MATAKKSPRTSSPAAVNTVPTLDAAVTAAKSPAKAAAKPSAKSARSSAATQSAAPKAGPQATIPAPDTPVSKATKKPKLVRDSFTIPKLEYVVLDELKARAAKLDSPAKKSELLRAGVKALAAMDDAGFLTALKAVPAVKTGRPNKLEET